MERSERVIRIILADDHPVVRIGRAQYAVGAPRV